MKKEYCKDCGKVVFVKSGSLFDLGLQAQATEYKIDGEVCYVCNECNAKRIKRAYKLT